jgi:hypothetical protein
MTNPISRLLISAQRRSAVIVLPLLTFTLITPMTVSCQRSAANPESGIEELRGLVRGASGRPSVSELTRIESRYPRTHTAALARFLRGYLYYGNQDYAAAIEALDGQAISATTALGDYAFFYRAESEVASDAKSARRDYGTVYTRYPDSLKVRDAKLRAAEMAVVLEIPQLRSMTSPGWSRGTMLTRTTLPVKPKRRWETDLAIQSYRRIYYDLPATNARVQAETRLAFWNASPKEHPGSFRDDRSRPTLFFNRSSMLKPPPHMTS